MNRVIRLCGVGLIGVFLTGAAGAGEGLATTMNVPFEVGKRAYLGGDDIVVTKIEGNAPSLKVGGTYRVFGTYALGSHDEATLAVSVTAKKREDGVGTWSNSQHVKVKKGQGKFELEFTMSCEGWPHVSLYSGKSFGEVYVGSGETVLKE